MGNLYIMCGIQGSGKSTYIKQHCNFEENGVIVSRDAIRFGMISKNDNYFVREKEVYSYYTNAINAFLENGYSVWADATQITKKSRKQLLNKINKNFVDKIICIYMETDLKTALKRNTKREGREYVPESVIIKMNQRLQKPELNEGFNIILIVKENGDVVWEIPG